MEFGAEFIANEADPPSSVPGLITLLQLDPLLKNFRREIERRYCYCRTCTHVHLPSQFQSGLVMTARTTIPMLITMILKKKH